MKIGISFDPLGKGHARFGKSKFERIHQEGFAAVDYNIPNTETEFYSLCEADLEKKMLAEKTDAALAHVEISQVHGPWRWPPLDTTAEMRRTRLQQMKRSILATRMLGCHCWVVHPIMPCGIEELDTPDAQKTWDLNLEFMSELLKYAREQDVTICLENMPMTRFSMAKPEKILEFVKLMNDDHFKICLDTGHVAVFPELSVGNVVRELGDAIKVIHVHDNMGDRDAHLWPTRGIIDWPDFVRALREIHFDGVFSLEAGPSAELEDARFEAECIQLNGIARALLENA